jgi:hypothetical protein
MIDQTKKTRFDKLKHRKNGTLKIAMILSMCAAMLVTTTPATRAAAAPVALDPLVGSWTGAFTDVPTDPQPFPPLPALFSFTSDGVMTETDGGSLSAPAAEPPGYGSPGHGGWRALGAGTYTAKFILLIVNPDGTLEFTGIITMNITVNAGGSSFQGTAHFEFDDPSGALAFAGDELVAAKKIKA